MLDNQTIKKFISYPDNCVRRYVSEYFTEGNIKDEEVALLLLDVFEKGVEQDEGWDILRYISMLPQTNESLSRLRNITASDDNTIYHIDNAIISAELDLLRKLPDVRPKTQGAIKTLEKRFKLSSMSTTNLWNKLWLHSKSGMNKDLEQFDFDYGELLIKEISTRNDFPYNEYREMLKIDYTNDYKGWDDSYLCILASELKSEDAIPFLIRSLKINGDFICDRAAEALSSIGTDKVVESIGSEYFNNDNNFKMAAISALENIKSEKCEELMIELLPKDKNVTNKTALGLGLCKLFSARGIPMVLSLLKYGYDRFMSITLLTTSSILKCINGRKVSSKMKKGSGMPKINFQKETLI